MGAASYQRRPKNRPYPKSGRASPNPTCGPKCGPAQITEAERFVILEIVALFDVLRQGEADFTEILIEVDRRWPYLKFRDALAALFLHLEIRDSRQAEAGGRLQ